jgi:hypothetical protein
MLLSIHDTNTMTLRAYFIVRSARSPKYERRQETGNMNDPVNHPDHYKPLDSSLVECIDDIKAALGEEQYIGFLRGMALSPCHSCRRMCPGRAPGRIPHKGD